MLASPEPGVWVGCDFTQGTYPGVIPWLLLPSYGYLLIISLLTSLLRGWSPWERQVSQKPGNVLTGFPEFFLSLWFQDQLWSHLKEWRLWKLVISTEVEHLHAYPVTLHFFPAAYITNWNAHICSPKGRNKKVHRSSICSRLKPETTHVSINNRTENELGYIQSKADYTATGMNEPGLHATAFPKDNTEWKKPAREEHILNDFTQMHFKNRENGLSLKYW